MTAPRRTLQRRRHLLALGCVATCIFATPAGADSLTAAVTPNVCQTARTLAVSPSGGRGTFRSISEALAWAAREALCGVTVTVAPGSYAGALAITRNTEIRGHSAGDTIIRAGVTIVGEHTLKIRDVAFRETPAPAAIAAQGSVVELTDVRVERALGFGIQQRGGKLVLTRVGVHETRVRSAQQAVASGIFVAVDDEALRGTGIY